MNKEDVADILSEYVECYALVYDPPSKEDWNRFKEKFGTDFGDTFVNFIELMSIYKFPFEIFNVSSGHINFCGSIFKVYDSEVSMGNWNVNMVPFCDIANGDCYCLNKEEGSLSGVYYFNHANEEYEKKYEHFDDWVKDLKTF